MAYRKPNTEIVAGGFDARGCPLVYLFAITDIEVGEELLGVY